MKALVIFLLVIATIIFLVAKMPSAKSSTNTPRNDQVVLHPAAGNTIVQMFDSYISDSAKVVSTFPGGEACTVLGGPETSPDGLRFYHLDCDGATGYVNTKWVR